VIGDLRAIARALNGEVTGGQVLCPGPGRSPRNRSLRVTISASSPDGFLCHSFRGDDWRACRDYVAGRLGLRRDKWKRDRLSLKPPRAAPLDSAADKIRMALGIWRGSADPRGTIVEQYLKSRALDLGDDIAGRVIRWNASIGAMVALFRNINTGKPQAISRTYLDREAKKLERKFLGPTGSAAIMLDAHDAVLAGLHIGEGVETCTSHQMSSRTLSSERLPKSKSCF
jgi:putative DNA primase/helicase